MLYGPQAQVLRRVPKTESSSYVIPMSASSVCTNAPIKLVVLRVYNVMILKRSKINYGVIPVPFASGSNSAVGGACIICSSGSKPNLL